MNTLFLGMALFFGIHVLTSTPFRAKMVDGIGERQYKAIFSILSFVGLGLMIWGFGMSRSGPDSARIVFNPPEWAPKVTVVFVFFGIIALASRSKSHIHKIIRQPMAVGIALWSIGHLFSNGNLNEVALFGGFLAYAIYDFVVSTAKGKTPEFQPQMKSDVISVVIGLVVFYVFLFFHFNIFGVVAL